MKDDLPYFSHDNDARNHPKMKALRARFGWTGYGQFWALNEMIAGSPQALLDLSRKVVRSSVACELGMTTDALDDLLTFLADEDECGLISYSEGIATTDRTQEDYEHVTKMREQKSAAGKASAMKKSSNSTAVEDSSTAVQRPLTKTPTAVEEWNGKNQESRAEQSRAEKNRVACNAGTAAAAAVTSGEVATALSSCPFASRLTGTDHGHIAERLTGLSLGLGFVGYCVERTREAKPKNPGGFLRAALYGTAGFEGYPEAYQEQARKPARSPARKPAPQTCAKCGSPLKLITDEAVCPDCGAAWYWDEDWQSWEQSSETWQGFDVSSGIAALRAKAGDQKQTPDKQTA